MTAQLKVTVIPKSSRREVEAAGDHLVVRVTVPPEGGKANEMCLALVADWLGVAKSRLSLLRGAKSRHKVIVVAGLAQEDLDQLTVVR